MWYLLGWAFLECLDLLGVRGHTFVKENILKVMAMGFRVSRVHQNVIIVCCDERDVPKNVIFQSLNVLGALDNPPWNSYSPMPVPGQNI